MQMCVRLADVLGEVVLVSSDFVDQLLFDIVMVGNAAIRASWENQVIFPAPMSDCNG